MRISALRKIVTDMRKKHHLLGRHKTKASLVKALQPHEDLLRADDTLCRTVANKTTCSKHRLRAPTDVTRMSLAELRPLFRAVMAKYHPPVRAMSAKRVLLYRKATMESLDWKWPPLTPTYACEPEPEREPGEGWLEDENPGTSK